jgi:AraC-like DNA-binding protein
MADSGPAYISGAGRRITARYSEPFRLDDLARSCGMSTSAFHRNFQAVTGYSPIQFQKQIRLQRSRLMLLTGVDDVATIGYRVGYDSASQFQPRIPSQVRPSTGPRRGAPARRGDARLGGEWRRPDPPPLQNSSGAAARTTARRALR